MQHNGDLSVVFHQASGMVSVQADCTIPQAIVLMDRRAASEGKTVNRVAQEVVDHVTRFSPS